MLLTTIPPYLTGSEACAQESASNLMLQIDIKDPLMMSSRWVIAGEALHGAVRSRYRRRGIAKHDLRRKKASWAAIFIRRGRMLSSCLCFAIKAASTPLVCMGAPSRVASSLALTVKRRPALAQHLL